MDEANKESKNKRSFWNCFSFDANEEKINEKQINPKKK